MVQKPVQFQSAAARPYCMRAEAAPSRPAISRDEWLSSQLGRAVWKLEPNCDPVMALSEAGPGAAMFFTRMDTRDIAALHRFEDAGFHVVDTTLTLETRADKIKRSNIPVRLATAGDRAAVARIAEAAFESSRLHLDPAIPKSVADASRKHWASNF